jgi:hypothetical protein
MVYASGAPRQFVLNLQHSPISRIFPSKTPLGQAVRVVFSRGEKRFIALCAAA